MLRRSDPTGTRLLGKNNASGEKYLLLIEVLKVEETKKEMQCAARQERSPAPEPITLPTTNIYRAFELHPTDHTGTHYTRNHHSEQKEDSGISRRNHKTDTVTTNSIKLRKENQKTKFTYGNKGRLQLGK